MRDNTNDYQRVALAIQWLEDHAAEQPALEDLAAVMNLSPGHARRVFQRWAGIQPKRFLQYLSVSRARRLLQASTSVLETSWACGLSGPGRLHDQSVAVEAMSPGEISSGGAGLTLRHGIHDSPFGEFLLALSPRGICWLSFLVEGEALPLHELQASFPAARLVEDAPGTAAVADQVFREPAGRDEGLRCHVRGSRFQLKVWRALLDIPPGAVLSYGGVARAIGQPNASRAVGGAVGANALSWLIPCHRVIQASGLTGNYRWGGTRKQAMLVWEAARADR